MAVGKVLESLYPLREKMLFIRGLYNQEALIGGIHSCQTGNLLTGAHLASGGEIRSGISVDQLIAQKLRDQTKVPSLVLGCEQSIAALHKNYSMIYSSHISWSSESSPTPLELYPALAFDRLFRDEVGKADKSVLDAVLNDAAGLRDSVSKSISIAWTNIFHPCAMSKPASTRLAKNAACKGGDRRFSSPTCRARRTEFRRTSISTCD